MFVRSNLSFITLNTRGLKEYTKRIFVYFCKEKNCTFFCTLYIFLQEAHSTEENRTFWKNQWGDYMLLSHGTNKFAAVAICFNHCPGQVIEHQADTDGHWITAILNLEGTFWMLINLYGYNSEVKNSVLFNELTTKIREFKK